MTQEIWTMSARELDRLAILERVESAGLRQGQAAAEMGVSDACHSGFPGRVKTLWASSE